MPAQHNSLLQRVATRPLPATLPSDRDVHFPGYAAFLLTPPPYFLTHSAAPALPHVGFVRPFTWSVPTDDLLLVFLSLTFALARPDHPDETIIFLFYVWADDAARTRLSSDPRIRLPSWPAFCALLRDAFPEIDRTPPETSMRYFVVLDMLLHARPITLGPIRSIMQRFALLFHISAATNIIPLNPAPPEPDHPHLEAAMLLLRQGTTAVLAATHHADSSSDALFNLSVRLTTLIGLSANHVLAGQMPMILDHIIFINDQLEHIRHNLADIHGLLLVTPDALPEPREPAYIIDLTNDP